MFFTSFAEGMTAWIFLRLGFRLINGWQVLKRGRRSHAMFVGSNIRISVGATLLLGNGFNDLGLDKIVVTT